MCDTYCNGQTDTHLVISQIWSTDRLGSISNRMRATMSTNGPQKRVHSSIQDIAWQHEDLLQHWIKGRCDEGSAQVGRTPVPRLLHIWDMIEHLEPLDMKLHWYQLTMPGMTGGVSDVFDHTKCLVLIHYDCTLKMIFIVHGHEDGNLCVWMLQQPRGGWKEGGQTYCRDRWQINGRTEGQGCTEGSMEDIFQHEGRACEYEGGQGGYVCHPWMHGQTLFVQHLELLLKAGVLFANQRSFWRMHEMTEYVQDVIDELQNVVATIESADVSLGMED